MDERFARITELFHRARATAPDERARFLDEHAPSELRAEVDGLLAAYESDPQKDMDEEAPLAPVLLTVAEDAHQVVGESFAPPRIAGYEIQERIGSGGMGTVYLAQALRPRRRVAVKVLRPEVASREGRARFQREARALARLDHPGVARILDTGECPTPAGRAPFLVMEFVDGVPVREFAQGLAREQRVALLVEICDAVAHAHERGVVHRDLKPANVLVTQDGRPKIVDFGLALESDADLSRQTRTGHLIGTLAYMSPEQARGDAEAIDARADVYALGVLAFELLTGRLPHDLDDEPLLEALRTIMLFDPPQPAELRGDLWIIVRRALEKDPDQRYPNARALGADLRHFLSNEPIQARAPSRLYQLRKFVRRHRAPVAGIGCTLIALVVGLVLAVRAAQREETQRVRADREAAMAKDAAEQAFLTAAAAHLANHSVENAKRALDRIPDAARGWAWRYLYRRLDRSRPPRTGALARHRAFFGHDYELRGRALAPVANSPASPIPVGLDEPAKGKAKVGMAGETIAILEHSGKGSVQRVHVYGPAGGAPLWSVVTGAGGREGDVALAADGRTLFVLSPRGKLMRFDTSHSKPLWTRKVHHDLAKECALSPDGSWIATAGAGRIVRIWDTQSGDMRRELRGHTGGIHALAVNPDGTRLASGGEDRVIRIWNPVSGELVDVLPGHRRTVRELAFSGNTLVSRDKDGDREWDLSGLGRGVLAVHRSASEGNRLPFVYGVAFACDGASVASCGLDGTARLTSLADGAVTAVLPDLGWTEYVAFLPDGRVIVSSQRGVFRWSPGEPPFRYGRDQAAYVLSALRNPIAVAPDGKTVFIAKRGSVVAVDVETGAEHAHFPGATATAIACTETRMAVAGKGGVTVWDRSTKEPVWRADAHKGLVRAIAFQPGGGLLATGGFDRMIHLWDVGSGAQRGTLKGHGDRVYALAFAPDGTRLASGSNDTTIRIWDVARRCEVLELRGHRSYVYDLDFSSDGQTLASASGDNTVRLWRAQPRESSRVPRRGERANR